ncbi:MAG: cytochrome c biogenesis protein CcdA [Actinomycetota bacterium]
MEQSGIFLGGSVIAAVVAGAIALFAPCCISVMLPAFFASSFQNRRALFGMTFVFALGVATVVVPIAVGIQAVRTLLVSAHTPVYLVGGLFMLALGVFLLAGGKMQVPMPGSRASGGKGPLAVYGLGVFSGVASACCAPVLAGVLALAGIAGSYLAALGLGLAYTFGLVAPLFIISLLWDRFDWRSSRLFRPRTFTWRIGSVRREVSGANLASGILLVILGIATIWVAFTGPSMGPSGGIGTRISLVLQRAGRFITDLLAWVPGWVAWILFALVLALIARRAFRQLAPKQPTDKEESDV